jgi:hypothetical protein
MENMLYMSSQSTANGVMTLTVTFKIGTDLDLAQVQVQNRVSQVLPKLPEEVRRFGVTTVKSSPDMTLVVHLLSPNDRYDEIYLRNYATLNVKDELSRLNGVGQVQVFGGGEYAMRIWIDPDKAAARGLDPGDIVNAIREQNIQVAAGTIGQQPTKDAAFELTVNAKGRLISEEEFEQIIVKTGPYGEKLRLRDVARAEMGSGDYSLRSLLNNKKAVGMGVFQLPGANALAVSQAVREQDGGAEKEDPRRCRLRHRLRPHGLRREIHRRRHSHAHRGHPARGAGGGHLPANMACLHHPARGRARVAHRHLCRDACWASHQQPLSLFGLVLAIGIVVDDAIVVVENVERNIRNGLRPRGGHEAGHEGGHRPDRRHRARALRRVHPHRVHQRPQRTVLQAVRRHHRHLHSHLGHQFADAFARPLRAFCLQPHGARHD